jgi:capsular polysaccharide transport system permease protein
LGSFLHGLQVQFDVIYALILREARSRFGKHLLGYFWALVEPMLWIGLILGVFYFVGRQVPFGMDIFTFVTTGVIPFVMVRNCVRQQINAIMSNRALLFFPQVHALDPIIARGVLEVTTIYLVFWIIIGFHELYYGHFSPKDPAILFGGLFLAGLFGATAGLGLCLANIFIPAIERVINRLMRVLFFTSGAFFAVNDLPRDIQEILLWNPLLHITSIVRTGWDPAFGNSEVTATYPLIWCAGFTLFGLSLLPLAAKRGYRSV